MYRLTWIAALCYERHDLPPRDGEISTTDPDESSEPGRERATDQHTEATVTKRTKAENAFMAFSMSSVGLEMGVCVFVGFGIGYFLDKEYATSPYLMLLCLGFGIAAGFRALFRAARQAKHRIGESNE